MEIDWGSIITGVVQVAVIPLLVAVVAYVKKWIDIKAEELAAEIEKQTGWDIDEAVRMAVAAAEQIWSRPDIHGAIIKKYTDRKQYACTVAAAWLATKGIEIDTESLANLIEAAVFRTLPATTEPK